jgi:hypothetical protein
MKLEAATSLDEVYHTLFTQPLIERDQFKAFYRGEVNDVRGGDKVAHMALGLNRSHGGAFYKTFLMGHPGVGKSTEMTRLSQVVADKYRVLRFSAQTDLDAAGFRPFDVLLAMMIRLAEETEKPTGKDGGAGASPSNQLIEDIQRWFATEKRSVTKGTSTSVGGSAGVKPSPVSWTSLLGLFVEIKGEIKYTTDRKQEITEYRLNAIASLIDLLNRLLDECNALLREKTGREWLFIGEDFDKPGRVCKMNCAFA